MTKEELKLKSELAFGGWHKCGGRDALGNIAGVPPMDHYVTVTDGEHLATAWSTGPVWHAEGFSEYPVRVLPFTPIAWKPIESNDTPRA